jgi:hypothetical protein
MAEQEKGRRQDTIEDRIEEEFRRASGGIPTVERMRQEFHANYANNPSLQSFIDRVADATRRRLLGDLPEAQQ